MTGACLALWARAGAVNVSALNVSHAGTSSAQVLWKFFDDTGNPLALETGSGGWTLAGSSDKGFMP